MNEEQHNDPAETGVGVPSDQAPLEAEVTGQEVLKVDDEEYVSSDAETEKMEDIAETNVHDQHPQLKDLEPQEDENGVTLRREDNVELINSTIEKPLAVANAADESSRDLESGGEAEVEMEEEEEMEEDEEEDEEMEKDQEVASKEMEKTRLTALKEITAIEYKFAELRQKLYENKLSRLQTELQMCLEGSHPELQNYYTKIASIRDYKLRRAYNVQKYELKCIDQQTRASRTFIHQNFYKQVGDLRSQLLTETTKRWYDINKERRDMDIVVPEVNYHIPVKVAGETLSCITGYAGPAQQRYNGEPLPEDLECENIKYRYRSNAVDKLEVIVDRMRLNNNLSDFNGLKKFYNGFPGAPDLSGLKDTELMEDIQTIQRSL